MGEILHARADHQGKVRLFREDESNTRVEPGLDPRAFAVYRSEDIPIAIGDQVRAFEPTGGMQRGDRGTVENIDKWTRTIHLSDGQAVPMDSKYLGHGYVVTVQGSQGQSVDHAIVVATSSSLGAMSKEAMYVASSRGKEQLDIITDDVEDLQDAVQRSVERAHGIDVAEDAYVRDLIEQGRNVEVEPLGNDIPELPAPVIPKEARTPSVPAPAVIDDNAQNQPALVAASGVTATEPQSAEIHSASSSELINSFENDQTSRPLSGVTATPEPLLQPEPTLAPNDGELPESGDVDSNKLASEAPGTEPRNADTVDDAAPEPIVPSTSEVAPIPPSPSPTVPTSDSGFEFKPVAPATEDRTDGDTHSQTPESSRRPKDIDPVVEPSVTQDIETHPSAEQFQSDKVKSTKTETPDIASELPSTLPQSATELDTADTHDEKSRKTEHPAVDNDLTPDDGHIDEPELELGIDL